MDQFPVFVVTLAGAGILGFVGWTIANIFACRSQIAAVRLEMAQGYAPNTDMQKFDHQLEKLTDKVDSSLSLLYQIAAKVNVSPEAR